MITAVRRGAPKPQLYIFIFTIWAATLVWFHPRLVSLLEIAEGPFGYGALLFFVIFVELAWLNGIYNIAIIIFGAIYRWRVPPEVPPVPADLPPVAVLYTTYNDFTEESVNSCLKQDYPEFTVYILDDSTDPGFRARIDRYAAEAGDRVRVVRRPDRRGFKAGNINHALTNAAVKEPVFALVDADELLPADFLLRTVAHLLADRERGFVQANHRGIRGTPGTFAADLGIGVDVHWRWYQPLRNDYGFVMLLGHGVVIRRQCWEEVGGFPEVVSEDLAFALRLRYEGWRGYFAEDVICYEEFPQSVRAFRIRHMKWTRGICELARTDLFDLLLSRRISLVEKLDIIFPTAGLPLALGYFLFMIDTNLILFWLFGKPAALTISLAGQEWALPFVGLDERFGVIMTPDFFLITLLTILSPILCFIIDLYRQPGRLIRFLGRSIAIYSTLAPITALGVTTYFLTGHATFLVTGDQSAQGAGNGSGGGRLRQFLQRSHPDDPAVQIFEIGCGIVFAIGCLLYLQISFLGIALGLILLPLLHHFEWTRPMRRIALLPAALVLIGLLVNSMSLLGMQTVFFGYGFHF